MDSELSTEQQSLLEGLFQFAPDAILVVDSQGRVTRVNSQVERIFGYAASEVLGQPVEMFVPEAVRERHAGLRASYHHGPHTRMMGVGLELAGRRKDGSLFPIEVALGPLTTPNGVLVLAIVREITERKRAQEALKRANDELEDRVAQRTAELARKTEQLAEANRLLVDEQAKVVQAEKLSSVGLLAAGVAHEINNPLAGVMACVKAIREDTVPPGKRDTYLETVQDGLERIRIAVRGLLDYARQGKPQPSEVEISELIKASMLLVAPALRQKGLRMDSSVAPDARVIRVDRSQLMQAVINVILNAIQATPQNGGPIEVRSRRRDGWLDLDIGDHGSGIPKDIISRICDPFFSTKPEGQGTGLGLAVTLGIVKSNGGDLAIRSEVGVGTTVTLSFPSTA